MNNNTTFLLKGNNKEPSINDSQKYNNSKEFVHKICSELTITTDEYNPDKTIQTIEEYLATKDKMERILYSEISSYIFSLETNEQGIFNTNIEKLMVYTLGENDNKISSDCSKIVVKIYDHFHLILEQTDSTQNFLSKGLENTEARINKEVKKMEREYITILGIFAAIVLAFVGGITFSSSVLQNIGDVSIYRLLFVIDALAVILANVLWLLINFIIKINDKEINPFYIKTFNIICLIFGIIIGIAWILNLDSLSIFIQSILPW